MESPPAGSDHVTSNVYVTKSSRKTPHTHMDWSALIDRGANGCIARRDMQVIARSEKTMDLSGIDNHTVRTLNLATAGGVVRMQLGDIIIIILHQAADMTRGSKTILLAGQLENNPLHHHS